MSPALIYSFAALTAFSNPDFVKLDLGPFPMAALGVLRLGAFPVSFATSSSILPVASLYAASAPASPMCALATTFIF